MRTTARPARCAPLGLVAIAIWMMLGSAVHAQSNVWQRGQVIGLRADTCIREGPGFGYRAHTRVPENDWAVMIIDGPRTANGRTWWDTSRKAVGDSSGGTGWVTQDQNDTDCDLPQAAAVGGSVAAPAQPQDTPAVVLPQPHGDLPTQISQWWQQQSAPVKWGSAIVALLLAAALWRLIGGLVIEFIGALIVAMAVFILMDLLRPVWHGLWTTFGTPIFGADLPDLALLLAAMPIVSWLLSLARQAIRTTTR